LIHKPNIFGITNFIVICGNLRLDFLTILERQWLDSSESSLLEDSNDENLFTTSNMRVLIDLHNSVGWSL